MLVANDDHELETMLRSTDITVPPRSAGRKKEHTERYAITHLLSALLKSRELSYPLTVTHRDKPDFLLKQNDVEIGIEHTEAVPQNKAKMDVLRDKVHSPNIRFLTRHQPGEPKKTAKELIEESKAHHTGSCWVGDSVERDWSDAMLHFVKEKMATFANDGFEKFEQNWLLIYDNWSLPALDREKSSKLLFPKFIALGCFNSFGKVLIITGNRVLEFSNIGCLRHEITNFWKKPAL